MSIIATAPVPGNGHRLRDAETVELPASRPARHRADPPTPCPPWCVEHTVGWAGQPDKSADRTTHHSSPVVTVNTEFRSGPTEPPNCTQRYEVRVWSERFDNDPDHDGHPVLGWPAVHMSVDGYDGPSMTAEQAERIGRALLDAAGKVRAAGRLAGARQAPPAVASPVWPPTVCPSWCPYVNDPAGGHACDVGVDHYEDRSHIHDHYQCTGENPADCEPGEVQLSLEEPWRYETGPIGERRYAFTHETLSAELSQHYREAEPRIRLMHFTGDPQRPGRRVDMTLGEVEQLVGLLSHLVELGRRG